MKIVAEASLLEVGGGRADFHVSEYLELDDGRRLLLVDDRGWSMETSNDADLELNLREIVSGVDNTILPDDAEETGETRTWLRYQRGLQERHGVQIGLDELKQLDVSFSVRIESRTRRDLDRGD